MSAEPQARSIVTQYDSVCMSCEEPMPVGTQAWWVKDVGIWHSDCPPPKNLARYVKDRAKGG